MRRIWLFCLFFLLQMSFPALAAPPSWEEELSRMELGRVEAEASRFQQELRSLAPSTDFRQLVKDLIQGKLELTPSSLLSALGRCLGQEIWQGGSLLGKLLVLGIVLAVLQQLGSAFEQGTVVRLAFAVCFLALAATVASTLELALRIGRQTVEGVVSFLQALFPVLLTLLAATGGMGAAALVHPTILLTLEVVGTLVKNVVFPLLVFSVILSLVNQLSEALPVSRLATLFRHAGLALLGICSTILLGIMGLQGVAGAVSGGLALRAAKYATGAFIPVAGSMLADAFEAVLSTSLLLKSAVGLAGMLVVLGAVAFPAVKLGALSLLFKLAAALVQPVEGRLAACLDAVGAGLLGVFAVVVLVGLLALFSIGLVTGLAHLTTSLR
ncbi:stage III sporulation protein AE [Ammonifex degensii KC4]|uniref:Stage III sporulation protein AE n=1 Tax=Ammonifex degensii (strain DSM 10501 / KC4) TaxID=429009 RepID=C9R8Z6_AMMDK|nr:stage III sporulation protein AE [Ammonifex degensii]ACX52775.1 stage III sporulation protein AE [Ammonifex degensii KC4]